MIGFAYGPLLSTESVWGNSEIVFRKWPFHRLCNPNYMEEADEGPLTGSPAGIEGLCSGTLIFVPFLDRFPIF